MLQLGCNVMHQRVGENEELFQVKTLLCLPVAYGDYLQYVFWLILKITRVTQFPMLKT